MLADLENDIVCAYTVCRSGVRIGIVMGRRDIPEVTKRRVLSSGRENRSLCDHSISTSVYAYGIQKAIDEAEDITMASFPTGGTPI